MAACSTTRKNSRLSSISISSPGRCDFSERIGADASQSRNTPKYTPYPKPTGAARLVAQSSGPVQRSGAFAEEADDVHGECSRRTVLPQVETRRCYGNG